VRGFISFAFEVLIDIPHNMLVAKSMQGIVVFLGVRHAFLIGIFYGDCKIKLYYVSTAGRDEEAIRRYINKQEAGGHPL